VELSDNLALVKPNTDNPSHKANQKALYKINDNIAKMGFSGDSKRF